MANLGLVVDAFGFEGSVLESVVCAQSVGGNYCAWRDRMCVSRYEGNSRQCMRKKRVRCLEAAFTKVRM